jgi:hypothetical protein
VTQNVVQATMRLSVVGAAGRADVAVPLWAGTSDLVAAYVDAVGRPGGPTDSSHATGSSHPGGVVLVTPTGHRLSSDRSLASQGLQHGDVLVAVVGDAEPGSAADQAPARPGSGARPVAPYVLASAGSVLGPVAGALAAGAPSGATRTVCAVVLLLCALVASLPFGSAGPRLRLVRAASAPAFAAGAGLALTWTPAPGGALLGVAVAAILAAVVAAVARSLAAVAEDELLLTWLVGSGLVAGSAIGVLLLGASPVALWSVLFVAAIVVARLLPFLVVDVPDQVLLDLDRLAVTAWSARERPRGTARRRSMIRPQTVLDVVHRGHRLVGAGAVAVAGVVIATASLLVAEPDTGAAGIGVLVLIGCGGAALALGSRSYRARGPRLVLRVAGWVAMTAVLVDVLLLAGTVQLWWWSAGCLSVGVVVVVTGLAVGRGWRSIWWARATDVVESLCLVLAVAAVPVATGLFTFVRELTSR